MPTTYAHWRFGEHCQKTLEEDLKSIIKRYRPLFDIGVHGPDIFFYYDCLKHNEVNEFGDRLHYKSMRSLLTGFRQAYLKSDNREASLAYLLGFLTHFTLDSYCHSYIEKKKTVEGPSHNKIESQLDRYLLILDGKDPNRTPAASHLIPDEFNSRIIAQFYPQFDQKVIRKTIRDQKFYLTLLKDSSRFKRWILTTGMKALKINSYLDLLLTDRDEPNCRLSNIRLLKYFNKGVEHYPLLARNMVDYLEKGTELLPFFDYTFAAHDGYMDIPLLNQQEEETYSAEFI